MPLPQNPPPSWGGYAEPRRREGVPIPLLLGVLAMLTVLVLACGVAAYLYFGGPTGADFDQPEVGDNPTEVIPTAQPTDRPTPTEAPEPGQPTDPPQPTNPVQNHPAIEEVVIAFDEQMRYLLQTGDTSTIGTVARGNARDGRINAAQILEDAGNCHWDYDHRDFDILSVEELDDTEARVIARVDRGGTVVCDDGERPEYAFEGPYNALYIVEFIEEAWYVVEYCPYDDCSENLKN
jgi:hypothetical protein